MRVTVTGVTVSFAGRTILHVASAEFRAGEISGVIGPSGSGKSSLLTIIAGLGEPDSGRVGLEHGRECRPPTNADVAWVPQGAYLLPERTVLDNVTVGALAEGSTLSDANERALGALRQVGLEGHALSRASVLSGGETQRVALARAICMTRPIIIADEPTASLDREAADNVAEVLGRLRHERVVIVATHDPLLIDKCESVLDLGAR